MRHRRDTGDTVCPGRLGAATARVCARRWLEGGARVPPARRRCEIATCAVRDRQPPRRRRSEATIRTPKQTLGTCAACARRTAGYIENTKAIFSGEREKVTVLPLLSPSRGASTNSSFEGALITFSAAGARRPVAAAQNASSSTAPVTTSSLWRFCKASSLWSSFALLITSALLAVGCFLRSGTGCCSPRRRLRLIHAVIASFASHNVA